MEHNLERTPERGARVNFDEKPRPDRLGRACADDGVVADAGPDGTYTVVVARHPSLVEFDAGDPWSRCGHFKVRRPDVTP